MYSASDYEVFTAFDMEYDYDTREVFDRYLRGEAALSHYLDMLNFQECVYPANYIKMRCLEHHDQPRICSFVKDELALTIDLRNVGTICVSGGVLHFDGHPIILAGAAESY